MQNLRLIPDIHRQKPIVKASFAYNRELIALIKSQKGARWSQSLRSWYFPTKEFLGHGSSKTTEIDTHVSQKSLAKIKSPLDHIIEQQKHENK